MKGARLSKLMSKPKVSNNNNISTTQIVVMNLIFNNTHSTEIVS